MVPHWSFFVSDMYNLDETEANSFTKTNYYSAGFSYLKNRTRIQLSYGRNRAGYVCSGRGRVVYMPAYTGSEPCDHFILLIKKQIMKFKKFIIPALCMAMLSAGCSGQDPVTPGNGQNGNGGTNENIENGLQVTASTTVINADGQDAPALMSIMTK